jgi:arginase
MTGQHRERPLSVIGAPSSAGAYGPGQERAPAVFRKHGVISALRASGRDVVDRGDGTLTGWRRDRANPANAGPVAAVAQQLADRVATAFTAGHDVLVLGGDCTIELGTVAGAVRDGTRTGLAYVDLDADLNTPQTGGGILDWMGVAHILAVPGAHDELSALAGRRPMLDPSAVRLLATDNITPPEQAVIDRLGVHVEPLDAVVDDPGSVASRTREWAAAFDRLLIHVDIDVLDYDKFPIAENTGRRGGLELGSLTRLLNDLCDLPNQRALTLTEINPDHASDERHALGQLIAMLAEVLR